MFVDADDIDARRLWHFEADTLGRLHQHRMRVAERQLDCIGSLGRGAIADTDDLELFAIAVGDADDHVGNERARQPMERTSLTLFVRALDEQLCTVLTHRDVAGQFAVQRALGAIDLEHAARHLDVDACRHRNRGFTYTGHGRLTTRNR